MRLTTLFLLATALPAGAVAQAPSQADLDHYQASLDSLVPALLEELGTPGAAVALFRDGKVVLAKGYGWANREKRQPVTRETLFNIGSISKTHAAWGLLRLVEDGKLDLDAPVERYLPVAPAAIRIQSRRRDTAASAESHGRSPASMDTLVGTPVSRCQRSKSPFPARPTARGRAGWSWSPAPSGITREAVARSPSCWWRK
jgi:hypothetical protein